MNRLAGTRSCERCHAPFVADPTRGGVPKRFCTGRCLERAKHERLRAAAREHVPPADPPRVVYEACATALIDAVLDDDVDLGHLRRVAALAAQARERLARSA